MKRLFKRLRQRVTGPVDAELRFDEESGLERQIHEIGSDLLDLARARGGGVLSSQFWSNQLMSWSMSDPAFKTQLFRFVDVMPSLRTPEQVHQHLTEYLDQPGVKMPPWLKVGIAGGGLMKGTFSRTITSQVESMAARFLAGSDIDAALPTLRKLWDQGIAFSVDVLGEACVSDAEAAAYQRQYLELIEVLAGESAGFEDRQTLTNDHLGSIPKANVSIKISSLSARINPADFEGSLDHLVGALAPILGAAAANGVFVNFDMEQHALKALTIALFKRCCEEFDFPAGLAMQAYLRSGVDDAEDMIAWAKGAGRQVTVRLIKGAYWDQEIAHAGLMNWPDPVWRRKVETDACFERMSEIFLSQVPRSAGEGGVKLALGSHNLRSIAHALAVARSWNLPDTAMEFQMLRGMADELQAALVERGLRVREYLPVGPLLPGMAYLVRRLLENTSNESWLRAGFSDGADARALLAPPRAHLVRHEEPMDKATRTAAAPTDSPDPASALNEAFHNTPWRDFADSTQRSAFAHAVAGTAVPKVLNDSSEADAERAVAAADAAFPAWRARPAAERAAIIRRAAELFRQRRDELAGVVIREAGKLWRDADADVCEAIDFCEYYARESIPLLTPRPLTKLTGEDNQTWQEPRGVTAVINPWNFPLAICCGMTVAALVTGNTAIVKPAEQTPGIARRMCEILWEAGVPRDVLHFLPGVGETVGAALVRHPRVANIAFTGSKAVGLEIVRQAAVTPEGQRLVKRVICEMGGKNAIIVDSSADLDEAVLGVRSSAFGYAGQKCSACSRAVVLADHFESFLQRLIESTRTLSVGDPLDPGTDMGPVIDEEAAAKIRAYIEIGQSEARLVSAIDAAAAHAASGKPFIGPHIFAIENYDPARPPRIATEEIFGPVLAVIRAADLDEALAIANQSDYKLTGGLFSRTPSTLARVRREFRVGNLYINRGITGALVGRQPFGGFGLSGVGAQAGGADYLRQFTDPRTWTENTIRRGLVPEVPV